MLGEIQHHYEQHHASLFVFTDLKLNSNLEVWNAIIDNMQVLVPAARWIASVHVDAHSENGLTTERLKAAAESGCVRLTTGLESGSQRMLDLMKKGTRLDCESSYLHAAAEAGISVRCTMIAGYPGETASDVRESAEFVRKHVEVVDRIKLCNFSLIVGTQIDRKVRMAEGVNHHAKHNGQAAPVALPLAELTPRFDLALVDCVSIPLGDPAYRAAMTELIEAVHEVNRKTLGERAAVFEGVM